MAAKASDGEYSLKLTGGGGISIDKIVTEPLALQILKLVMGDTTPGAAGGAGIGAAGAAAKLVDSSTPKTFMAGKRPTTDLERVACLAYYLTHHRGTQAFKTKALSELNVEAAGGKFSNISATAQNAARPAHGLLSAAVGGNKQITARGEALVEALPDRDKAKAALDDHPAKKPRKKRARKKAK